jgi:hypothetical protein
MWRTVLKIMIPHRSSIRQLAKLLALVACAAGEGAILLILAALMIPSFGFICCARCVGDVTLLFAPS